MSDFVPASPVSSFLGAYQQGQEMQAQKAQQIAQQIAAKHQQELQNQQAQQQASNALLGHAVTLLGQGYNGKDTMSLLQPFADTSGITLPDITGLQGAPEKEANRISKEKDKQLDRDAKMDLAKFKAAIWQNIVDKKLGNADRLATLKLGLDRADTPAAAQQLYIQFLGELGQPGAATQPPSMLGQPVQPTLPQPSEVMLGGNTGTPSGEVNPDILGAIGGQLPVTDQIAQATQIGASGQPAPPDFMNTPFGGTFGARVRHMNEEDKNAAARLKVYQDLENTKELQYHDLQQYHEWKRAHENNVNIWNHAFKQKQADRADAINKASIAIRRAQLALNAANLDQRQKTTAFNMIVKQQGVLRTTRGELSKQIAEMDRNIISNREKTAAVDGVLALTRPTDPGKDADAKLRANYNQALNFYNAKVMGAKDRQPDLIDEGKYFQGRRQELQDQMDEVKKSLGPIADSQNTSNAYVPKDIPVAAVDTSQALRNAGVGLPGVVGSPVVKPLVPSAKVMHGAELAGKSQAELAQIRKDIQSGKVKIVP